MLRKVKAISGVIIAAGLAMGATVTPVLAADSTEYSGKTVILYSGNLRGDVDAYAKLATAKKDYESKGATVYLVDAGNHLQGSTYANTDRGLGIYNLMDAAGYEVAAMGTYDFVYADATTGISWHGNLHKFYTQAELKTGAPEETYSLGPRTDATDTRPAKAPVAFSVIATNMDIAAENTGYYSFTKTTNRNNGTLNVGFMALSDPSTPDIMQDDYMLGYNYTETVTPPAADVVICLDNNKTPVSDNGADFTICAPTDGEMVYGAVVIDDEEKTVIGEENFTLDSYAPDATVAALANDIKSNALPVIATSDFNLEAADRVGWRGEINMGDLVSDALVWYAQNKMPEFQKDVPLVGIINGGNCDQFIYSGDINTVDVLRGLPFSPNGIGIIYVTGQELLETIEASQNMDNKRYDDKRCPGFAQVSGMEYVIDTTADYDEGEEYGNFFLPASVKVVTIKSINGEAFDPEKTYAVVADNVLIKNGNDTYAKLKEVYTRATDAENPEGTYIDNGNGLLVRHIVEMYMEEELGGVIPAEYETSQGRIITCEGHAHTEIINSVAATCTTEGYSGDVHCLDCDTILEYGEVLDKLSDTGDHQWTVSDDTDAEGWKVVKEPTTDEEGLAERVCSIDNAKESKSIDKLPQEDPMGWVKTPEGYKYYSKDGAYTGWHKMGKAEGEKTPHWSYFTKDGILVTGWKHFTKADGEKVDHWSYFGDNGWLRTGWQYLTKKDGEKTPHWSYFGDNGWLRTGWQHLTKKDGEKTPHWSYFGNNGWLRTGWQHLTKKDGEKTPHWSYFGDNGWMRTGWQDMGKGTKNPDGNAAKHRSYFGDNGWLRTGSQTINGKKYVFDSKGWLTK